MPTSDNESLIELKQVEFTYPSDIDRCVLNLPAWKVSVGERVLLIGESGSGKSTLLKLLSGILVPDSGSVRVAGMALETMRSRQRDRFRAEEIGYVAQSFNLIPYLSALDNIKLASYFAGKSTSKELGLKAASVLEDLNITESHWHRPIRELSAGQQQRIAIARAIINKPKLLIADEPTSSLDQSNRDNFMSILMETAETHDMTLVFVSHDLSLSGYFDRIDSVSDINMGA